MTAPCFECDAPAAADHHVVPRARGGTRTIPLCLECHGKVHDMTIPALQRAGIEESRHKYGGTRVDPAEARTLARMGYSAPEIAEALDVSASTIRRYLKEHP